MSNVMNINEAKLVEVVGELSYVLGTQSITESEERARSVNSLHSESQHKEEALTAELNMQKAHNGMVAEVNNLIATLDKFAGLGKRIQNRALEYKKAADIAGVEVLSDEVVDSMR